MKKRIITFSALGAVLIAAAVTAACLLLSARPASAPQQDLFGSPSGKILLCTIENSAESGVRLYDCEKGTLSSLDNTDNQFKEVSFFPGNPEKLTALWYNETTQCNQVCIVPIEDRGGSPAFGPADTQAYADFEIPLSEESPKNMQLVPGTNWLCYTRNGSCQVYQPGQDKETILSDEQVLSVSFLSKSDVLYGAFSHDSDRLLSAVTRLNSAQDTSETLLCNITNLSLSHNKRYLSYASELHPGSLFIYDLERGEQTAAVPLSQSIGRWSSETIRHTVSPDGRYLACATSEGLTIFNVENGSKREISYTAAGCTNLEWAWDTALDDAIEQIQ